MQLPENVRRAIDRRAEQVGFAKLRRATGIMSEAYRDGGAALSRLPAAERVAAYLATRMPATYASAHAALGEVRSLLGDADIRTALDLGAGTGAASLAIRAWFPEARIAMIERDPALSEAAREWLPDAPQIPGDIARMDSFPEHDLVIASYVLGELQGGPAGLPVFRMWRAARVALLLVEPGTSRGYTLLQNVRAELLASGAHMLAPCPHEAPCPLAAPDWCHFAARVERSSLHRRLKNADLNYEDEKFSYVAVTRQAVPLPAARIIRRPAYQPGLITLQTCAPAGVSGVQIKKRDGGLYRAARRADWGDVWGLL